MRPAPLLLLLGGLLLAATASADELTPERLDASPAPGARFGSAVAVGEQALAVGAYLDAGGNGAVYVFQRDDNGAWKLRQTLPGAAGEQLGYSVAIDGDILYAGAPFAAGGGAVYSYSLSDLTRARQPLLLPHPAGGEIGCALAAAGGIVAIGACGLGGTGGVYLVQEGGALLELNLPAAPGDRAGTAVALSPHGDILVAGAPFHAGSGPAAGAAYVSSRGLDGLWSQPMPLPAAPRAEDAFGYAVATNGTFIAVGAPLDDARGQDAGAVYLFTGPGWSGVRASLASNPGDQLGVSVALDGGTLLAGARRHGPVPHAGAVYRASAADLISNPGNAAVAILRASQPLPGVELGFAVARHGETDLAGAFLEDNGAGAAYVFAPPLPTVQLVPPLRAPRPQGYINVPVSVVTADGLPIRSRITVALSCSGPPTVNLTCPSPVTFQPGSAPQQSVKVSFSEPATASGDVTFTVTLSAPQNAALGSPVSATATIVDDTERSCQLVVDLPTSPLVTSESGQAATFTVQLATQPTAPVTVSFASDTPTEGTVAPTSRRFTPGNWNLPQSVTVTGVDDTGPPDSDAPYSILITTASADACYAGLTVSPVPVVNLDDDQVTGTEQACRLGAGEVLFTFTLTAHDLPQAEVDLTDTLPLELLNVQAVSSDAGAAWFDPLTNRVDWRISLAGGASAILTLVSTVVPSSGATILHDQASFRYDANGDGVLDTSGQTDEVIPLPHAGLHLRAVTIGDSAHPLPPCPSSPE